MKKGGKVFWTICAALGGIGILLIIVGVILGASSSEVESMFGNEIYKIRNIIPMHSDEKETLRPNMNGEYRGIQKLDVSVAGCEVIVQSVDSVDGDVISLDTSRLNRNMNIRVEQDGNELEIESSGFRAGRKNNGQLYIFIPHSGNLTKADFEIGAGTLFINEIRAKEVSVEVGAGSASIDSCDADSLRVECGAGQVEVNLAGGIKEYNYRLECAMGEIYMGKDTYEGLAVERRIDNGAAKNVRVECGVGKVVLENETGA